MRILNREFDRNHGLESLRTESGNPKCVRMHGELRL